MVILIELLIKLVNQCVAPSGFTVRLISYGGDNVPRIPVNKKAISILTLSALTQGGESNIDVF